ncbi:MAG: DUF2807 domain-containing protein, partial [Flavobacteriaceae bacterium]|nr:DUF2807 domain-containing protein [Flavobacteriaceae bacterium]
ANESAKKVGEFANESAKKAGEFYDENKPYINRAGGEIWNAIKYIIGGIFAVMAISSLVGIFAVIIMFGTNSNFIGAREVSFWIGDGRTYNILLMLMILSSLFMTIIFSLICIKIFSPKTKLRNMGWVLLALFIAMMSLGVYFGVNMANQETMLNGNKEETEEIAINTNSDSLLIDIKQVTIPENFKSYDDIDEFFSDKKSVYEEDYPDLNVTRKLNLKSPYLIIKKRANGYNIPLKLDVPVEISGNKILLPNYVKYPYAHRFRDYDVDYELVVPEKNIVVPMNKKIDFSGDLDGDGIDDGDDDEYANTHNSFSSGEDSEIRNVAKFTGIDVSTGVNVNFTQSDNQKVLVEADSDDMKHLITKVENGTLKIYIDNKGKSFLRLGDFSVSVSAPDLERISTSSGAEFSASNTLKQNDFKISADSGSRFRADLEAKNNVNINISSSSDIEIDMKSKSVNFTADSGSSATLTGNTNKAIYHLSSAASCDAENFLAKEADANVSSGGSLKLNVSESLNSKTSSAGSVRYSGKPKNVTADNSVGGSTKEMD